MATKSRSNPLPPMAPFPTTAWRNHMPPVEWEVCLDAWIALADAHLSLSSAEFLNLSVKDESLSTFLVSYASETASSLFQPSSQEHLKTRALRLRAYLLSLRLLDSNLVPENILQWLTLANLSKIYGRANGGKLMTLTWKKYSSSLESKLGVVKSFLIKNLEDGLKGDLKTVETQLRSLNHLLHVSPDTAAFFMAGSDFLDSLISCFKLMNPPLRKVIISTTYLSFLGLTEGERPQFSTLVDQLYSLKSAAEAHKAGPTNVNDSLVAHLVTQTPALRQLRSRLSSSGQRRTMAILASLEDFKIPGISMKPPERLLKRKQTKGKGRATELASDSADGQLHIQRIGLISQVQDLFPDLGSGFVVRLLDEYGENVEHIISQLLEDSLPAHLMGADKSEQLVETEQSYLDYAPRLEPHSTPPQIPTRRNVFDNDEFDRLAVESTQLHFGQRNPDRTADDVLQDRSNAPNRAAILSALAAFDSDDDERDDTYDVEDVGGTVDSAVPGSNPEESNNDAKDVFDETLFNLYKATPEVFGRDAATRKGKTRLGLKEETGLTDEAIEGWGLMLSRDPRQMRKLEAKFSTFQGAQRELAGSAWKASPAGSGTEDSDMDAGSNRGRGGFGRPGRGGRGRGGGNNVAGPTGEKDTEHARQRKEANKSSRANHNRRDQRAKKMARGGFPG